MPNTTHLIDTLYNPNTYLIYYPLHAYIPVHLHYLHPCVIPNTIYYTPNICWLPICKTTIPHHHSHYHRGEGEYTTPHHHIHYHRGKGAYPPHGAGRGGWQGLEHIYIYMYTYNQICIQYTYIWWYMYILYIHSQRPFHGLPWNHWVFP